MTEHIVINKINRARCRLAYFVTHTLSKPLLVRIFFLIKLNSILTHTPNECVIGSVISSSGTNDGNSSNDFLLRNGKESDNMRNFINSYEVTGMTHCLSSGAEDNATGRRYLAQNAGDEEEEGADEGETQEQDEEDEQRTCEKRYTFACRDLFRSQRSTMAKCYSKIDPLPFLVS